MSTLFHVVDDAFVILRSRKGVYKQAKVYTRGEDVYAGHGGGFVKLFYAGTSCPDISWSDLTSDRIGKLTPMGAPKLLPAAVEMRQIEEKAA